MEQAVQFARRLGPFVRHLGGQAARPFVDHEAPGPLQEAVNAVDVLGLPGFLLVERPHEQFVQPQRVRAPALDHVVGVGDVQLRLRHLLDAGFERLVRAGQEHPVAAPVHGVGVVVLAAPVAEAVGQDHPLVEQAGERLGGRDQPRVVEHLLPEAGVEQVQHRVLDAADVEIDRHPVALQLARPGRLRVLRVDVAQEVPAGPGPLRHRVRLAPRLAAVRQSHDEPVVAGARQRRPAVGGGLELVEFGQFDGQVLLRHGQDLAGGLAVAVEDVEDRERFAPVALAREQPVPQPVLDAAVAVAFRDQPLDHAFLRVVDQEAVQEAAVDRGTILHVRLALPVVRRLDGAHDRQVELDGELPVALVLAGDAHDGARAVAHQDVVGNPDRHRLAGRGVRGAGAGEDAGLALGQVGALQLALVPCVRDVSRDRVAPVLGRDLGDQGMFGRQHAVGGPEQRVRPGREHGEAPVAAGDRHPDLGAVRLADPVALHLLDVLGPVDLVEVVQEPLGVGGDAEHPLPHRPPFDRVAGVDVGAVLDLFVGQHRAQCRAPPDRHVLEVGEAALVQLQEDPLRPAVVVRRRRVDLPLPVVGEAETLDLAAEVRHVSPTEEPRVLVVAHRGPLHRQPEGVPAHRVEHVVPLHAPLARHHVGRRVALGMADVQPLPGGVGEHVEDVVLRPALQDLGVVRGAEGVLLAPDPLPLRLDFRGVVDVPTGPGCWRRCGRCVRRGHLRCSPASERESRGGRSPRGAAAAGRERRSVSAAPTARAVGSPIPMNDVVRSGRFVCCPWDSTAARPAGRMRSARCRGRSASVRRLAGPVGASVPPVDLPVGRAEPPDPSWCA